MVSRFFSPAYLLLFLARLSSFQPAARSVAGSGAQRLKRPRSTQKTHTEAHSYRSSTRIVRCSFCRYRAQRQRGMFVGLTRGNSEDMWLVALLFFFGCAREISRKYRARRATCGQGVPQEGKHLPSYRQPLTLCVSASPSLPRHPRQLHSQATLPGPIWSVPPSRAAITGYPGQANQWNSWLLSDGGAAEYALDRAVTLTRRGD